MEEKTMEYIYPNGMTEGVGLRDMCYVGNQPVAGARCGLLGSVGPLKMSVFASSLRESERTPERIELGLLTYHRSIFLVIRAGEMWYDTPYLHERHTPIPTLNADEGLLATISICDEFGICHCMRLRTMSHRFSNAFFDAARVQVETGLTEPEHARNISNAYSIWSNPKKMLKASTVIEKGWEDDDPKLVRVK
jgi:hypothetical protein